MKISVSFIKSNYNEKETIKKINETNADYIHVDIMDGKFVPNKNYTFNDILNFTKGINKPLDVHLMCEKPEKYIEDYATLNTEYITFHLEAVNNPLEVIKLIHAYGIKCGISIKPNTSINQLIPYLDMIEQVLVMSVEPGAGGQPFMESVLPKIEELNKLKTKFILSVDGGVNELVRPLINADMIVSGSYICKSDYYQKQIDKLR